MIPCLSRCTFVVESAADMLASQEAVYLPKLSFGERLPSTSEGNPGAVPPVTGGSFARGQSSVRSNPAGATMLAWNVRISSL